MPHDAAPPLIVVAYAVAPGPGGPEAHVNAGFLRALADGWPSPVGVISGGGPPIDRAGRPLADRPGWTVDALGPCGEAARRSTLLSRLAGWAHRRRREGRPALAARLVERAVFARRGQGLKSLAWELAASRHLQERLRERPEAVVLSRALPGDSLAAVLRRGRRGFRWVVNLNDPYPPRLWPGLYAVDPRADRTEGRRLRRAAPRVDAWTFPCRRLRELEVEAFPAIGARPHAILPHLSSQAPSGGGPDGTGDSLELAFAGTLRKSRISRAFAEALSDLAPEVRETLSLSFHLARPNASAEAWIRELPIRTRVTLGRFDGQLDDALEPADALLDLEADQDRPLLLTKVINYLRYRKPIVALCPPEGTTWELLSTLGCGYLAPADDRRRIAAILEEAVAAWRHGAIGERRPSTEGLRRFSAERILDDLDQLIRAIPPPDDRRNAADGRLIGEPWP